MIDKSIWKKVKLSDIAFESSVRVNNPKESLHERFVGLEHFVSGDLLIRQWGSTSDLISAMKEFQQGDVLLARRNVYLKRASQVTFDGLCSGDAIVLRRKTEKITNNFLVFILNTEHFWNYANANAGGSMSKRLNVKQLMQYEFLLPPIDEQNRIAELLWAIDSVIEGHSKSKANLKSLKDVVMNDLACNICSDKKTVLLGDMIEYRSGQVNPNTEPYSSMPLIAPNHIESDTGKILGVETAKAQNAISGKYFFNAGEIVYSKIRPKLNKVIIAPFDGLCSADMYPLKCKSDKLKLKFLYYLLLSKQFVDYADMCSVRTSIPKLNRKDMSNFEFSCPTVNTQEQFIEKLDCVNRTENVLINKIEDSRNLLASTINYYLGGAN